MAPTDEQIERLAALTGEDVAGMSTLVLRATATELLSTYSLRRSVLSITLGEEALDYGGVLSGCESVIALMRNAHDKAGTNPKVTLEYGRLEMTVWETDDSLRHSLRYAVASAREKMGSNE